MYEDEVSSLISLKVFKRNESTFLPPVLFSFKQLTMVLGYRADIL